MSYVMVYFWKLCPKSFFAELDKKYFWKTELSLSFLKKSLKTKFLKDLKKNVWENDQASTQCSDINWSDPWYITGYENNFYLC